MCRKAILPTATLKTLTDMNDEIKARENQLITDMMELLRQEITDILGDELDCTIDLQRTPSDFILHGWKVKTTNKFGGTSPTKSNLMN